MSKAPRKSTRAGSADGPGALRIIGGQWRGRKLRFAAAPGLRPSPDRVRETLFNWLMAAVPGARCLDLFAGSGALGLEALSRAALSCFFVDTNAANCRQISEHLRTLQCAAGQVANSDAAAWLRQAASIPFDIVFLDPPFHGGLLGECCQLLEQRGWLSPSALIYIETASDEPLPALPPNWRQHRDRSAGKVAYRLFERAEVAT
jgi:16S rRNA (guanine966-N2)-methyltransferase